MEEDIYEEKYRGKILEEEINEENSIKKMMEEGINEENAREYKGRRNERKTIEKEECMNKWQKKNYIEKKKDKKTEKWFTRPTLK